MVTAEAETTELEKSTGFRALVVDDDHDVRRSLSFVMENQGWEVGEADTLRHAREIFPLQIWDIVYLDKRLPDGDGITLIEFLKEHDPNVRVIMITGQGSAEEAMLALTMGAYDYLAKPFSADDITRQLQEYAEEVASKGEVRTPAPFIQQDLVGRSQAMIEVAKEIQRVAPTDRRVLITGPSGTGKEVVARRIYMKSMRSAKPFLTVNCGAINRELIESELFGHVRGAFTGAHADRQGLLQEAHQGTIFLDEITETAPDFQVKLLRFLQEGEIRRVGSNAVIKVDVRVLAASNRDVEAEVSAGNFRTDLFFRLNQSHIHIPPLRERPDDILPLVEYFIAREAGRLGREISYAASLIDMLYKYEWDGNVRELEHAIIHAAGVCDGVVRATDLPRKIKEAVLEKMTTDDPLMIGMAGEFVPLEEVERKHIMQVYNSTGGSVPRTAKILGLHRRTLERKLRQYMKRSADLESLMREMRDQLTGERGLEFFKER